MFLFSLNSTVFLHILLCGCRTDTYRYPVLSVNKTLQILHRSAWWNGQKQNQPWQTLVKKYGCVTVSVVWPRCHGQDLQAIYLSYLWKKWTSGFKTNREARAGLWRCLRAKTTRLKLWPMAGAKWNTPRGETPRNIHLLCLSFTNSASTQSDR